MYNLSDSVLVDSLCNIAVGVILLLSFNTLAAAAEKPQHTPVDKRVSVEWINPEKFTDITSSHQPKRHHCHLQPQYGLRTEVLLLRHQTLNLQKNLF